MKILTVAIPSYNSEAYMRKAIDHALVGGEDVEVLVIDDGSKDSTLKIAQEYERKYPNIVRAIHQENKGHGGAVNTGLREATGVYYKVCDSDDFLAYDSYIKAIEILKEVVNDGRELDAMICNYVYDKLGAKHKRVMHYTGYFPEKKIFTWTDIKRNLPSNRYVLMHSLIYRTQMLRDCGFELPEHCFYVDNLMAFTPMIYVKTMYYLNMPLYRYFIGREGQSVNEEIMMGRLDQQLRVTREMIDRYQPSMVTDKRHLTFLVHYMGIMMTVSSILLMKKNTPESLAEKKLLWKDLEKKDKILYARIRLSPLGLGLNLPTEAGRRIAVFVYGIAQRFMGFN